MCQHVRYWRFRRAKEAKPEVGRGPEDEASPSLANVREFVPPTFAMPLHSPYDTTTVVLVSI